MIHYNGIRYTKFIILEDDFLMFNGSDAIKDFAVLVGFHNHKAYINMIRRWISIGYLFKKWNTNLNEKYNPRIKATAVTLGSFVILMRV